MAPKFGLDDGSISTFDSTLVLATMLMSQLNTAGSSENPQVAGTSHGEANDGRQAPPQERSKGNSGPPSDQTRIWSDLSDSWYKIFAGNIYLIVINFNYKTGSRTKGGNGAEPGGGRNENDIELREIHRIGAIHISDAGAAGRDISDIHKDSI
nr:uncharacterized protein LOC104112328 isoform X2 [Nicotiana tomentosiformis]